MLKQKKSSQTTARRRRGRPGLVIVQSRPAQRDSDRGTAGDERADKPNIKILTKKQVLARVPMSYPTLWSMMQRGLFPRSRQMSEERVGWIEAEIDNWIAKLPVRAIGDERKEAS